jgi:hypothetical protein
MQDFGGKTSGEELGRPKRRWEDIIKNGSSSRAMGGMLWLRIETVAGFCECGNELTGFHKMRTIS